MPIKATTQLQAINKILSMVGSAPITQAMLDASPQTPEVALAVDKLDEVDLAVQEQGWWFNTEQRTLSPEEDNTINSPDNAIDVVRCPKKEYNTRPIMRGAKLYDRANFTDQFTQDVEVVVTFYLSWDELPEAVRQYILIRAGRLFVVELDNSEILWQYSNQQENEARAKLLREDLRHNKYTLRHNPVVLSGYTYH
jgi:hypothetical protein